MPPIQHELVQCFQDRLIACSRQSPLLRVRTAGRGARALDCHCLREVEERLPGRVMEAVVAERDVRFCLQMEATAAQAPRPRRGNRGGAAAPEGEPAARPRGRHEALYYLLENRIRRHAELGRRETGCHCLWLGYPLLYAADSSGLVLAPLLLWPARVELDRARRGGVRVGRETAAGPAKVNRALALWVADALSVRLGEPDIGQMRDPPWGWVCQFLDEVGRQLDIPAVPAVAEDLEPIPGLEELDGYRAPILLHSAVLGFFRSAPEAIVEDLRALADLRECSGAVAGFIAAEKPPEAQPVETPAEAYRHLVFPADFSQERAVWQARQGPGLVLHGPPGTGKSQTIVNIIADTLARGQTALMVCQKEVATSVVLNRLRAIGLGDLCVSVHDPEAERRRAFEQLRTRVARLGQGHNTTQAATLSRDELSRRVEQHEARLDGHARALNEAASGIGLSYRQVLSRLFRLYYRETGRCVRALDWLPSLRDVSARELEEVAGAVRVAGHQFSAADAGRNPWRYRTPVARELTPDVLRQDVTEALRRIGERIEQHDELIGRLGGAGIPLPSDLARFAELAARVLRRLGAADVPGLWTRLCLRWLTVWHGTRQPWLGDLLAATRDPAPGRTLASLVGDVERAVQRLGPAQEVLAALPGLETYLAPHLLAEPTEGVCRGRPLGGWLARLRDGFHRVSDLYGYETMRRGHAGRVNEAVEALEGYEARLAAGEPLPRPRCQELAADGRWWAALVRFPAYEAWRRELESRYPELLTTPCQHHSEAAEFRQALQQKRTSEARAICAHWEARQWDCLAEDWGAWFRLNGNQHVRSFSFREAVDASLDRGLLRLWPCWLVGPSAAAQLFPLREGLFDVVIFDEASQCPLEQAVPAVFRGKRLVVVGDEHQLPPTSFFSSRAPETEDGEQEDEEATEEPTGSTGQRRQDGRSRLALLREAESLLEAAIPTFRNERLLVHYRSDNPALIQFSNRAFYRGELEIPVRPARSGQAIRYEWVGGTYCNRTNVAEAERVVKILRSVWCNSSEPPTIGVVTFNQPQRELIEDLIQRACCEDRDFASRYECEVNRTESNQFVGFFVRNLENVQGDERDLMIFSTTFGRDSSGRFYRRFGPVGARGGQRRLNVAVTRARLHNIIVTSMPIEELTPDPGGHEVPPSVYLRRYLEFARAISEGRPNVPPASPSGTPLPTPRVDDLLESPLEQEVYEFLVGHGYAVEPQVGEAGFRIDLAVWYPDLARGYALGIECDGATFHGCRSARIRDVWRQEILERLGWRIHRVWSTRWWHDRENEEQRLLKRGAGGLPLRIDGARIVSGSFPRALTLRGLPAGSRNGGSDWGTQRSKGRSRGERPE